MMRHEERQISQEQYFRAMLNGGFLTKSDEQMVFTDAERLGYGACSGSVFIAKNGLPYVNYTIADSCD